GRLGVDAGRVLDVVVQGEQLHRAAGLSSMRVDAADDGYAAAGSFDYLPPFVRRSAVDEDREHIVESDLDCAAGSQHSQIAADAVAGRADPAVNGDIA